MPDLKPVYVALREVFLPYAEQLDRTRDDDAELYLNTRHIQANKKPLFFGAVQQKGAHVSVHLMPVYVAPQLLDAAPAALKAKMKGRSCFHFKTLDPVLFEALTDLVAAGFASYRQQGFV